jgi:urease accessory protein
VRREGRLVFADELSFDGAIESVLNRPACAGGGRSCATLLHMAPNAEERLEPLREALVEAPCEWGASAWNGLLLVRMVSPSPEHVRAAMVTALASLRGRDAPRVWN